MKAHAIRFGASNPFLSGTTTSDRPSRIVIAASPMTKEELLQLAYTSEQLFRNATLFSTKPIRQLPAFNFLPGPQIIENRNSLTAAEQKVQNVLKKLNETKKGMNVLGLLQRLAQQTSQAFIEKFPESPITSSNCYIVPVFRSIPVRRDQWQKIVRKHHDEAYGLGLFVLAQPTRYSGGQFVVENQKTNSRDVVLKPQTGMGLLFGDQFLGNTHITAKMNSKEGETVYTRDGKTTDFFKRIMLAFRITPHLPN